MRVSRSFLGSARWAASVAGTAMAIAARIRRDFIGGGASFLRGAGWVDNTGSMANPPTTPSRRRDAALVLAALVVGLGLGAAARASGVDGLVRAASGIEVVGTMWINAIRMTVIPLVAALTVAAVATSGDAASLGRVGGWAVAVFTGLLLMGGFVAMLAAPLSIDRLEIPPDVAARLRESLAGAAAAPATMPSLSQRIVDIVPVNPIKAAVDGAILPVVVFALALGLALTRVPEDRHDHEHDGQRGDIPHERPGRGGAHLRPERDREREHADRRERQHPLHEHEERVGHGAADGHDDVAAVIRHARQREPQREGEHHDGQDRAVHRRLDRVHRHDVHDALRE